VNFTILKALHRVLSYFVFAQLTLWVFFTAIIISTPLDLKYGTHLYPQQPSEKHLNADTLKPWINNNQIYDNFSIAVSSLFGQRIWSITNGDRHTYLRGDTLAPQQSISNITAQNIARSIMPNCRVTQTTFITKKDQPDDIAYYLLPAWRVDFDDDLATRLYIHPYTGAVLTARTKYWYWLTSTLPPLLDNPQQATGFSLLHLFIISLVGLLLTSFLRIRQIHSLDPIKSI